MKPASFNIPPHVSGDTFQDLFFTIMVNEQPLDLSNVQIDIWFRQQSPKGIIRLKLSTTDNTLTKSDIAGQFLIPSQIIDLKPNRYYYDIQLTLDTGKVYTYVSGYFNILSSITNAWSNLHWE